MVTRVWRLLLKCRSMAGGYLVALALAWPSETHPFESVGESLSWATHAR